MKLNGFIKIALFFFAAFAVGITATGLLFGFTAPRFGHKHREGKRQYVRELKVENERLKTEIFELKQQLETGESSGEFAPPPPWPPQKAPPARHDHK